MKPKTTISSFFVFICYDVMVQSQHLNTTIYSMQPIVHCPLNGVIDVVPGRTERIAISLPGLICTLTRVNDNEVVPVARSYNKNGWEAVAGPYATSHYSCDEQSCEIIIPERSKPDDSFQLRGMSHYVSKLDEAARFFEQATFGVTQSDFDKLTKVYQPGSDLMPYFVQWIYEQTIEQPTSHRAFWRERTTPIHESDSREGRKTIPCEKGSTWRGYSFTVMDVDKYIVLNPINGKYACKCDELFTS